MRKITKKFTLVLTFNKRPDAGLQERILDALVNDLGNLCEPYPYEQSITQIEVKSAKRPLVHKESI